MPLPVVTPSTSPSGGPALDPKAKSVPSADVIWTVFVILFTFLAASFPARNPDVWGSLAAGRELTLGRFATLDHSWLFDIGLYVVYSIGGEFGVVFTKASLVALAGWQMLRLAGGSGRLISIGCTGLAVLCLSVRANVRPETVSFVALAVAMRLATRPSAEARSIRSWVIPLSAVLLIWANSDRGVITGLIVVAATVGGQLIDRTGPPIRRLLPGLGLILVCSFANPAYLTTGQFTWPRELVAAFDAIWDASARAARSPLTLRNAELSLTSPAVLAYYPLLFGGLVSFALNRRGFRWGRFLPWVLTAGLSGLTDRGVPVFAVVGGPVLALNLSEFFAARGETRPGRWATISAAVLAGLFLLTLWPGWLLAPPYEPRRWAFDLPPSPAAAAAAIRQLAADGRWPASGKTVHLTDESARTFRWFLPDDHGGYDPQVVAEIETALAAGRSVGPALVDRGYTRMIVYHPVREVVQSAAVAVVGDPTADRWELTRLVGDVFLFSRPTPDGAGGLDLSRWDAGLNDGRETPRPAPPRADGWRAAVVSAFTTPNVQHSIHRDEAAALLLVAEASRSWVPIRNTDAWPVEQAAGLAAAVTFADPMTTAVTTAVRLSYIRPPETPAAGPSPLAELVDRHFRAAQPAKDEFLTGAVYAAIRAGRRAVAEQPDDHRGHLLLGRAYYLLMEHSRERAWAPPAFRKLLEIRQAQAAASLHRAIELSPVPLPQAHQLLYFIYSRLRYLDLSVEQMRAVRAAAERAGDGATAAAAAAQLKPLESLLAARTEQFAVDSARQRVADRADTAKRLELTGQAVRLLRGSDVSAFGSAGMKTQLDLMVRVGQATEVIDWTDDDMRAAIGPNSYHWFRGQAMAAVGDYAGADRELAEIVGGPGAATPDPAYLAESVAMTVGKDLLSESPAAGGLPDAVRRTFAAAESEVLFDSIFTRLKNRAEVSILRAVLALEVGDVARGRELLGHALFFSPELPGPNQLPTRTIAQSMLDRLDFRPPDRPGGG